MNCIHTESNTRFVCSHVFIRPLTHPLSTSLSGLLHCQFSLLSTSIFQSLDHQISSATLKPSDSYWDRALSCLIAHSRKHIFPTQVRIHSLPASYS